MRARTLIFDALLVAAVGLLALATVHQIRATAAADRQLRVDDATFHRYARGLHGLFVRRSYATSGNLDVACARHRPNDYTPADFRLCLHIRQTTAPGGGVRGVVVSAQVVGMNGHHTGRRENCRGATLLRSRCHPRLTHLPPETPT
jgi:hypothetical protein